MDAADQVPGRMSALEELLHGEPGVSQFGIKGCIHVSPKIGQDIRRQVFAARHGRNGRRHMVKFTICRNCNWRLGEPVSDIGNCA